MSLKPKINLSGFVLSALTFDNSNSEGDQEGFLIGTITKNVTSEISDQSMCNTQEELSISICSSVPCGDFLSFYNANGCIQLADLDSHLGERKSGVVGWYRFRRHCPVYPSLREAVIHKNLKNVFSKNHLHLGECFVYGILTTSNLQTHSTHSFDYAFYSQTLNNTFKPLVINLLNLGDTKNIFRRNSVASAYLESSSFNSVLRTPWSSASSLETEELIGLFHNKLCLTLENLRDELIASNVVADTIKNEVGEMDKNLSELKMQKEKYLKASSQRSQPVTTEQSIDNSINLDEMVSIPCDLPIAIENVSFENIFETSSVKKHFDSSTGISKRSSDTLERPDCVKRACYKKYFGKEEELPSESCSDEKEVESPHEKILNEANTSTVSTQTSSSFLDDLYLKEEKDDLSAEIMNPDSVPKKELKSTSQEASQMEEVPIILPTEPMMVSGIEEPIDIARQKPKSTQTSFPTVPVLKTKSASETIGAPCLDPNCKTSSDSFVSAEKAQECELDTNEMEINSFETEQTKSSDSSPVKDTSFDPNPSSGADEPKM